ncbi:MAG: hypothetical protein JWP44_1108 [Mucilaginibacter sp.]|nr:hypothetical protein [Mucilaginibacter sp.]
MLNNDKTSVFQLLIYVNPFNNVQQKPCFAVINMSDPILFSKVFNLINLIYVINKLLNTDSYKLYKKRHHARYNHIVGR